MAFTKGVRLTGLAAIVVGATASLFAARQQNALALPLGLNGLVRDAQQQERKYEIRLFGQTLAFEIKDGKVSNGDWSDDNRVIQGTLEQVRNEYAYLTVSGIIPDVRHLYKEIGELAQLMSRDINYLANPDNGFGFNSEDGYWNPKKTDWKINEIDGLPLSYKKRKIFIGGVYYDFGLSLVSKPLSENSMKITDLFELLVYPSEKGNEDVRIDHLLEVRPGQDYERYVERRRLSTGKRFNIDLTLSGNATGLSNKGDSLIQLLDFSGAINPLMDALKKQVVYFDRNWNPIKP